MNDYRNRQTDGKGWYSGAAIARDQNDPSTATTCGLITVSYTHLKFVDAATYAEAVNEARGYEGLSARYTPEEVDACLLYTSRCV